MKKFNTKTIIKHLKTATIIFLGVAIFGATSHQTELESQLEENQQLLATSLAETDSLKSKLDTQSKKLSELEEKEETHQNELDKQKEETKKAEENLKNKEKEIKAAEEKQKTTEKELEELKTKHEKLEKDHQELNSKYAELENSFQDYKNQNDQYIELGKQAQQLNASTTSQQYGLVQSQAPTTSVYYKNCSAARAAGAAPVRIGDPGYGSHLDRDGDGIGCE